MNHVLIEKTTGNQIAWMGSTTDPVAYASTLFGSDWEDRFELQVAE